MMRPATAQSFLESINISVSPIRESNKDGLFEHVDASDSCTCACRCGRSPTWKAKGKRRSRSYTGIRTGISELSALDWEPHHEPVTIKSAKPNAAGEAPLERLPAEILGTHQMLCGIPLISD